MVGSVISWPPGSGPVIQVYCPQHWLGGGGGEMTIYFPCLFPLKEQSTCESFRGAAGRDGELRNREQLPLVAVHAARQPPVQDSSGIETCSWTADCTGQLLYRNGLNRQLDSRQCRTALEQPRIKQAAGQPPVQDSSCTGTNKTCSWTAACTLQHRALVPARIKHTAGQPAACTGQLLYTVKKRFTSFPSQAGMSLTKLPLGRNNSVMTSLFPPMESLEVTSRLGT
jgi:hypothetical protein